MKSKELLAAFSLVFLVIANSHSYILPRLPHISRLPRVPKPPKPPNRPPLEAYYSHVSYDPIQEAQRRLKAKNIKPVIAPRTSAPASLYKAAAPVDPAIASSLLSRMVAMSYCKSKEANMTRVIRSGGVKGYLSTMADCIRSFSRPRFGKRSQLEPLQRPPALLVPTVPSERVKIRHPHPVFAEFLLLRRLEAFDKNKILRI